MLKLNLNFVNAKATPVLVTLTATRNIVMFISMPQNKRILFSIIGFLLITIPMVVYVFYEPIAKKINSNTRQLALSLSADPDRIKFLTTEKLIDHGANREVFSIVKIEYDNKSLTDFSVKQVRLNVSGFKFGIAASRWIKFNKKLSTNTISVFDPSSRINLKAKSNGLLGSLYIYTREQGTLHIQAHVITDDGNTIETNPITISAQSKL